MGCLGSGGGGAGNSSGGTYSASSQTQSQTSCTSRSPTRRRPRPPCRGCQSPQARTRVSTVSGLRACQHHPSRARTDQRRSCCNDDNDDDECAPLTHCHRDAFLEKGVAPFRSFSLTSVCPSTLTSMSSVTGHDRQQPANHPLGHVKDGKGRGTKKETY